MEKADFRSLSLSQELIAVLGELGYETPTPIQAQSIPLLLKGKDLIGQSETGSGKTAAFALPILQRLGARLDPRRRGVRALVLCPTRELCAQVAREIRKLARRHAGLQVLVLTGGAPMGAQLHALERGVHLVVGTPGRVLDHLTRRSLDLSDTRTLVLDEADRMLEMGFQEEMERILEALPRERQTVLFSATFPKAIEALSRDCQIDPVRVTVTPENRAVASIEQMALEVEPADRVRALLAVLEREQPRSAIVFCNFKATVAEVARDLLRAGISAEALHGDLEQRERDRIMAKFRNRSLRVLVATDVAARGLDVEDLQAVVNFELPQKPEVYVHRVGRTGRAGRTGLAVSFISSRERAKLPMIESYAGIKIEVRDPGGSREDAPCAPERIEGGAPMRTLYISGGRKDKMRPGDILGALTGEAGGLEAADVGKIEIHDRFSYVAVTSGVAELALQRLRDGRVKGRKFRIEAVR